MERKLLEELWNLRFQKMLSLEKQSIVDYEALLAGCKARYKGHSIETHLEKLILDENKHKKLVEELLEILESQKD